MVNDKYQNTVDFEDYLDKSIQNDEKFSQAWEEYQPEFEAMRAVAKARAVNNLTQKELAQLCGIDQADISKIERGLRNPSVSLLRRIAKAMNMSLHIEFVPNDSTRTVNS